MPERRPISVFVVDDSALMRQMLTGILSRDPELQVIGTAADPIAAWRKIREMEIDVLTLDVEMPRMDGLTFLEKLMRARAIPVVMVSSLTERGCDTTLRALELGAVDFVTKPKFDLEHGTAQLGDEIIAKVKGAARARVATRAIGEPVMHPAVAARDRAPNPTGWAGSDSTGIGGARPAHRIICVGASTGGTEALRVMLSALPADAPGMVIVQHMPEHFTSAFARRLNDLCDIRVREAVDGDRIEPGLALIAPGARHMRVRRHGAEYRVEISADAPVNRHRPSVDVLFASCAEALGAKAVAVMLTGMGNDGAQGLRQMHDAGARTIAQNEATCVVFGMPRAAIETGAVDEVLPLESVAAAALRLAVSSAASS